MSVESSTCLNLWVTVYKVFNVFLPFHCMREYLQQHTYILWIEMTQNFLIKKENEKKKKGVKDILCCLLGHFNIHFRDFTTHIVEFLRYSQLFEKLLLNSSKKTSFLLYCFQRTKKSWIQNFVCNFV